MKGEKLTVKSLHHEGTKVKRFYRVIPLSSIVKGEYDGGIKKNLPTFNPAMLMGEEG
jgi:hypothetical protein